HNRALRAKVRGRNRITRNRSVQSRSLAPSPPPPRIAIASDVPRGAASTMEGDEASRLVPVTLTHLARRLIAVSSAITRPSPSLITKLPSSPAAISEQACTVASFSVGNERLVY